MSKTITKLEAAQRQLDCAIRRWLDEDDLCSVQTLAWAAFTILRDLGRKANPPIYELPSSSDFERKAANFLKHADKDPDAVMLEIDHMIPELVFYDAIRRYHILSGSKLTKEMEVAETILSLKFRLHEDVTDYFNRLDEEREEEREFEYSLEDMDEDDRDEAVQRYESLREMRKRIRHSGFMGMGRRMLKGEPLFPKPDQPRGE